MGSICSTYHRANAQDSAGDTRGTTNSSSGMFSGNSGSDPQQSSGDRRKLRITVSTRTTEIPPVTTMRNEVRGSVVSNPLHIDDRQIEPGLFTLDKCSTSMEVKSTELRRCNSNETGGGPKSVAEANIEMILQRTRSGVALDGSGMFTAETARAPSRTPKDGNLVGSVAARLDSLASAVGRKPGIASPSLDVFALPRYRSPRNHSRTKQSFTHVSGNTSSFSPHASFPDASSTTRLEPMISSLDVPPADCDVVAWTEEELEFAIQKQSTSPATRRMPPSHQTVDDDVLGVEPTGVQECEVR